MFNARPHPHLKGTILHISNLPASMSNGEIAELFQDCLPIRLNLGREAVDMYGSIEGTVEFRDSVRAEKALTTLSNLFQLSPYPPPFVPLPAPVDSVPRVISGFPEGTSPGLIWEALRPAALRSLILPHQNWDTGYSPEALVEFWYEDDARWFEINPPIMPTGEVLSIVPYNPRRQLPIPIAPLSPNLRSMSNMSSPSSYYFRSPFLGFSPLAPSFVPNGGGMNGSWKASPPLSQIPMPIMNGSSPNMLGLASPNLNAGHYGPGQQVQPAPSFGPGSTSVSGLIDPCNLFCKNLDPSMSSNDMFTHFRVFGRIVSARVMRDDAGNSKGFGFVSYQTPQEAHAALVAMDGALLGSKRMVVRLHEPKKLRGEKLAELRLKGSPDGPSVGYHAAFPSIPGHLEGQSMGLGLGLGLAPESGSHSRRNSDPAEAMTFQTRAQSLSRNNLFSSSPEKRHEALMIEQGKREHAITSIDFSQGVDQLVSMLTGSNPTMTQGSADEESVDENLQIPSVVVIKTEPSRESSREEITLSKTPNLSRTNSLAGKTEHNRLLAGISLIEPTYAEEIADMILTLKKKERALCLFNTDFLREKVAEAKGVILSLEDDADEGYDDGDDEAEEDEEMKADTGSKFEYYGADASLENSIAEPHPISLDQLRPPSFAMPQRTQSAPINPTFPFLSAQVDLEPDRRNNESVSQVNISASYPVTPLEVPAPVPVLSVTDQVSVMGVDDLPSVIGSSAGGKLNLDERTSRDPVTVSVEDRANRLERATENDLLVAIEKCDTDIRRDAPDPLADLAERPTVQFQVIRPYALKHLFP
ncbi:Polyadenylate-binding protein (RRM superfamily) [Phaffia rhodozyma]|uniref:Polyadenylate-binding protein (RRM superfamily) n=1 Tax=Phaffia rhodozyma TaxID=264483 RepID=A0A0F7SMB1_PHARH|nr:Polyadenylate-binding protein (RRM superfamily) [Phaffia rhodozyma]